MNERERSFIKHIGRLEDALKRIVDCPPHGDIVIDYQRKIAQEALTESTPDTEECNCIPTLENPYCPVHGKPPQPEKCRGCIHCISHPNCVECPQCSSIPTYEDMLKALRTIAYNKRLSSTELSTIAKEALGESNE